MQLVLYTDGAARGNPGPAAIGVVLLDRHGKEIEASGLVIGTATNNEAEYRGLLYGLERALAHRANQLEIRTDSLLLAQQLQDRYHVRAPNLKPLYALAKRAMSRFDLVTIRHVPRAMNRRADGLANQALDNQTSAAGT